MIHNKYPLIVFLLLLPLLSHTQVLDLIDVHLTLLEKIDDGTRPIPNATLMISDQGEVNTDENGRHTHRYALRNQVEPEINIALVSEEHKLLKPLDGSISIDPTREEMFIEFVVVNMADESEEFKQRIAELETRVAGLKRKNQLSRRQINTLYATLVDTILYFEGVRNALEIKVDNLEDLTEEQQKLIQAQQNKIDSLEDQVDGLTHRLTEALEERYLRQNQYFKSISANLTKYIRKSKDIKDHLPYIKSYYSSNSFASLDRDMGKYNEAFAEIDDQHQNYLEGVERYWENEAIDKELEEVFDLLLKGIHLNQMVPTLRSVMDELYKQKPSKAQKLADNAYENIAFNIRDLEKKVNRILVKLRNN